MYRRYFNRLLHGYQIFIIKDRSFTCLVHGEFMHSAKPYTYVAQFIFMTLQLCGIKSGKTETENYFVRHAIWACTVFCSLEILRNKRTYMHIQHKVKIKIILYTKPSYACQLNSILHVRKLVVIAIAIDAQLASYLVRSFLTTQLYEMVLAK